MGQIGMERPWKTNRGKRGQRLVVVEAGDRIWIGDQRFVVVRVLEKGRLVVRQAYKRETGEDMSGALAEEANA